MSIAFYYILQYLEVIIISERKKKDYNYTAQNDLQQVPIKVI